MSFAYGSNMLVKRITERCRSARPLGVAELPGHELRWHKRSHDGSGKCDVIESTVPGANVFGVLYEIPLDEKSALDTAEGLGHGYEERRLEVLHLGQRKVVLAYVATNVDPALKPYTWYRALVVAGAKEHSLPEAYIEGIQSVAAMEDADTERHEQNFRLLDGVGVR